MDFLSYFRGAMFIHFRFNGQGGLLEAGLVCFAGFNVYSMLDSLFYGYGYGFYR